MNYWCHQFLSWLPALLLPLSIPPMVLFPSRKWAQGTISLCGWVLVLDLVAFHILTYGNHWDFSRWLIDNAHRCYADGCPVIDSQENMEFVIRHAKAINFSLLVTLVVIGIGCVGFDAWLHRRPAIRTRNRREGSGIHWVEDQS